MSPKLFRVILPVDDVDRAAQFYGTVLGISGSRVSPGRHYFNCEGVILACFDPKADGDEYVPTPNPEWLYFAVENLEDIYEACRRAAARLSTESIHDAPAGEIAQRPWGERSFYVMDPFGNKICFVDRDTVFMG